MRRGGGRYFTVLVALAIAGPHGASDEPVPVVHVQVEAIHDRQVIEGFGGSIAYWGYDADETALRYAFEDLGATLVRVPGDIGAKGEPEQYRAALRRVAAVAPEAKVLVSFWQPRSAAKP